MRLVTAGPAPTLSRGIAARSAGIPSRGVLAFLLGIVASGYATAGKLEFEVHPGPVMMSEEEKALASNPDAGVENAVILIEETRRLDGGYLPNLLSYHRRAKILSNEGRELAEVIVPFNRQEGLLMEWWGRTILPDGTVLELKQKDLAEQELYRSYGYSNRVLKGSLPGVTAGCVIDYGYVFRWNRSLIWARVPVQMRWPVREFRYGWTPDRSRGSSWDLRRGEGLGIDIRKEATSIFVTGKDLPAILLEPFMPPFEEVGAALYLSYSPDATTGNAYWESMARRLDGWASSFAKDRSQLRELIARMNLAADADLMTRIRAAYDWIAANIANTSLGEDAELDEGEMESLAEVPPLKDVVSRMEANAVQLDCLFLAVVRELGGKANLMVAADRRDHYYTPTLLTLGQFEWLLVAVRDPGGAGDREILADAGSGLPFGEIPWWLTGVRGFLAAPSAQRDVLLLPGDARRSVLESRVSISFPEGEPSAAMKWSMQGTGQRLYSELRDLRGATQEERRSKLESLCGGKGTFEVSRAESASIESASAAYGVECEGEFPDASPPEGLSSYNLHVEGPWWEPVPDLAAKDRVHPVIFTFPRTDITSIDAVSPPGFTTSEAPAPVMLSCRFGHYTLSVTTTDTGYHVERVFALTTLGAPASEYEPLRDFLAAVRKADRTPLVYRKARKTGGTTP